jgi:hypothetical protein
MPILPTDILLYLSLPQANAGFTAVQGEPDESLGGFMSVSPWNGGSPGDLFQDLTPLQQYVSANLYRAVFVLNNHLTKTLQGTRAWFSSRILGGGVLALGVDPTAVSLKTSSSPQALAVSDQTQTPTGVTFASPDTFPAGVLLGDLAPGHCRCLWLRLGGGGAGAVAVSPDGWTLGVGGTTYA